MDVTPTRRHNEHTFVMLTLKFNKKQISKVVMVFTTHICVVGLLRVKERLRDLSLSSPDDIPKQDYSRVKYVSNDFSFAPGKLITSNTEPLLSVAEGKGLTEGIVGHDCTAVLQ